MTKKQLFRGGVQRAVFCSVACSALALLAVGCASSSANTKVEDPPLLEQPSDEEQAPSSPAVQKAIEHIKAEEFDVAEQLLAKAVVDTPEDPQAAFFHGVALEGVGKPEQAETEYRRAITLQPKLIESSVNLAFLLIDQKKYDDALKVTESAMQYADKDPALLANRALSLDLMGRPESIAAYEQLLEVAPDDSANRFNYAVALFFIGKRGADAKAQLAMIKTDDPSLQHDVAELGAKIDTLDACDGFLKSPEASKKTVANLSRAAECKYLMEDEAGAKAALAEATAQVAKDGAPDMALLGEVEALYIGMGDFGGCVSLWDAAVAKSKSAEALAHRARCKVKNKNDAGAKADLLEAVKVEPKKAIGHYYLGKVQQKEGKLDEAKKSFESAVAAEPESDFGKAAAAELQK